MPPVRKGGMAVRAPRKTHADFDNDEQFEKHKKDLANERQRRYRGRIRDQPAVQPGTRMIAFSFIYSPRGPSKAHVAHNAPQSFTVPESMSYASMIDEFFRSVFLKESTSFLVHLSLPGSSRNQHSVPRLLHTFHLPRLPSSPHRACCLCDGYGMRDALAFSPPYTVACILHFSPHLQICRRRSSRAPGV